MTRARELSKSSGNPRLPTLFSPADITSNCITGNAPSLLAEKKARFLIRGAATTLEKEGETTILAARPFTRDVPGGAFAQGPVFLGAGTIRTCALFHLARAPLPRLLKQHKGRENERCPRAGTSSAINFKSALLRGSPYREMYHRLG